MNFITQKRSLAKNDDEKDFCKLLDKSFYGKTIESVRNCMRLEFNKNYEHGTNI